MQGSSNTWERFKRVLTVLPLAVGYIVGAFALAFGALAIGLVIPPLPEATIMTIIGTLLLTDLVSIIRARLNMCTVRRQARKSIMYKGHRQSTVGLVWGFDAGFGVATYRVTSGLWVLLVLSATTNVGAWPILIYAFAFVAAWLIFTCWPRNDVEGMVIAQTMAMSAGRRLPQLAYLASGITLIWVSI